MTNLPTNGQFLNVLPFCPNNMAPHQVPDTPPTQVPLSAPVVHKTIELQLNFIVP